MYIKEELYKIMQMDLLLLELEKSLEKFEEEFDEK